MARPVPTLKAQALGMLARREHSAAELKRKLLAKAAARDRLAPLSESAAVEPEEDNTTATASARADEVDALLVWLASKDLLSEERFVEGRVHARAQRFGQRRIEVELAQHGLSLGAEQRGELKATELARAHAVWQRRFHAPADSPAERAKQMRFLASRGFAAEVIRQVVAGAGDEEAAC